MNAAATAPVSPVSPVTSEVTEAAVVVAVEVVAVTLAPPAPDPRDGAPLRSGTVEVEVLEVLKGRVDAAAGDRVEVPVQLRSRADLWADAAPGQRYVAFCDGGSHDPAVLLAAGRCRQLASGDVVDDVRAVRAAQRRHPTTDRLLTEAWERRATAGEVWARYVWSASREALRTSPARLDRLLATAEDAGTRLDAQRAYLVAAYEDVTVTGAFPDAARARLVRAMLRSALDPQLRDLRSTLLGTWAPNLVAAPLPVPLTPDDVFGPPGAPDGPGAGDAEPHPRGSALREAVAAELADPRDPATSSDALLAWLQGRP
jgi:hypothetical protein